jgi:hypothetical protein
MGADPLNEGGQFWTPILPAKGSILHAGSHGISVHTARSQLKSVFAKTDTHRQAELVALAGKLTKGQ